MFSCSFKHTEFQSFLTYSDLGKTDDSEGPSTLRIQSVGIAEPTPGHISFFDEILKVWSTIKHHHHPVQGWCSSIDFNLLNTLAWLRLGLFCLIKILNEKPSGSKLQNQV